MTPFELKPTDLTRNHPFMHFRYTKTNHRSLQSSLHAPSSSKAVSIYARRQSSYRQYTCFKKCSRMYLIWLQGLLISLMSQSTDVARFIKTVTIWMNLGLQSSKKNMSESSPLLKSVLFISSNAGLTGFVDMGGNA